MPVFGRVGGPCGKSTSELKGSPHGKRGPEESSIEETAGESSNGSGEERLNGTDPSDGGGRLIRQTGRGVVGLERPERVEVTPMISKLS